MSKHYNQRNAKVDQNQPKIVKALRRIGAKVLLCHQLKNAFDILVGFQGKLYMMEIKNSELLPKKYFQMTGEEKRSYLIGKLSEGEKECLEMFESVGVTYYIVSTIEEAIGILQK